MKPFCVILLLTYNCIIPPFGMCQNTFNYENLIFSGVIQLPESAEFGVNITVFDGEIAIDSVLVGNRDTIDYLLPFDVRYKFAFESVEFDDKSIIVNTYNIPVGDALIPESGFYIDYIVDLKKDTLKINNNPTKPKLEIYYDNNIDQFSDKELTNDRCFSPVLNDFSFHSYLLSIKVKDKNSTDVYIVENDRFYSYLSKRQSLTRNNYIVSGQKHNIS